MTQSCHGLPPDPEMRGFHTALDPVAMAGRISEHVLGGKSVESCRIVRFRYRRGDRLIVVYEADVAGGARGPDRHILTGRIHVGRPLKPAKSTPGQRSTAGIADLDMQVDIFPHDRRLPALPDFATGRGDRTIALLRQGYHNLDPVCASLDVAAMRYRPGLSATLRYRFADAPDVQRSCYVKVTSDPDVAAEATAARRVNAALQRTGASLRLSVPLAVDQASGAALYHPADGQSLQELAQSGADVQRAGADAGAQLAALHSVDAADLPATFATDIAETIDRTARIVSWACPEFAHRIAATAQRARRLADVEIIAPVHRDMKPDHIFLSDLGRAEVIDTGSVSAGNPLVDVGNLIARIDLLVATGVLSPDRASTVKSSLCAAYFDRVPRAWHSAREPARAYAALLVATHAIQGLLPRWQAIVASEIDATAATWG